MPPLRRPLTMLFVSAACVSVLAAPAGTTVQPGGGYRQHRLAPERVTLELPSRWPALRNRDVVFPGVVQTLTRSHPDLFPLLAGLVHPESGLRLVAFEPRTTEGVTPNLTVSVQAGSAASVARWRSDVTARVRRSSGLVGGVRARALNLPAGAALRLDYDRRARGSGPIYSLTQIWVVNAETTVVLAFAARQGKRPAYEPMLGHAAKRLAVPGSKPCPPKRVDCA